MPFSAATGLAEAAWAIGTAMHDQTQAISMKAVVNVPKTRGNPPDRIFNAPPETSKDIKIFLPPPDDPVMTMEIGFNSADSSLLIRYLAVRPACKADEVRGSEHFSKVISECFLGAALLP
jgi:hypothetical protein